MNPHELDYKAHTMLAVIRAWKALRDKKTLIEGARQEAADKAQRLTQRHTILAAQVEKEKENREAAKQQAKGFATGSKASSRDESKAGAQTALDSLKQFSRDQKNLADQGRRIQDEQELSDTYASWIGLVDIRQRAALHNLIESLLWILVVALVVYMANRLIDRLFGTMNAENKRIETLRSVVKFAAQVLGAIVVVFIVFGMPSQTTTILGLAGAGLTVAGKVVIMAFFGWFLLMGRNGIRVGDWVEINGVGGEVIEIGLLKTVLLETGNWTDAGHPTGRRVSFVNSFAIEGHYFNFSTSGQWMWDELQLTIPADKDPYAVIDGLQKLVAKDTEANAHEAEQEWQHTTTRYHVQTFSAEPAINVRPSGSGVEVRVRYITRAYERHETRKRLYEAVVAMMRGETAEVGLDEGNAAQFFLVVSCQPSRKIEVVLQVVTGQGQLGTLIVTGASRGIGAAIATLAAERGFSVAVNFATGEAEAGGDRSARLFLPAAMLAAIQADVAREEDVVRLFETAESELGEIKGLVNNAAITGGFSRVGSGDRQSSRASHGGKCFGRDFVRARSRAPYVHPPWWKRRRHREYFLARRTLAPQENGSITPHPRVRLIVLRLAWLARLRPKEFASTRLSPG